MKGPNFSSIPLTELYRQFSSSTAGLSVDIAEQRMKSQAGFFKKESHLKKQTTLFVRQFTSPLVLLLVIAVILSAVLGESSDSIIILIILLTTGIFGFLQESSAGKAMEELRSMIEMKHTVVRDQLEYQLSSWQIVAGDVLILDAGDIIPADCRIIESNELHVNESSLTGESFPVEKMEGLTDPSLPLGKKYNCLWQGTNVISGTARALVLQTGQQTVFGHMAHSLLQTPESSFEKGIRRFGYFLLRITVLLAATILIVNIYFKRPLFDSVLFSLALAVGMTPELLPAIMTFSMSQGAKRMLRRKVIVRKLSSIFNFGSVEILCTDKTGTITEGVAVVKDIIDLEGQTSEKLRTYAFLNASLQSGFSNPIDQALIAMNLQIGEYEKINEIPYDFVRRLLSVAVSFDKQRMIITKGAFKNIMQVCSYIQYKNGNVEPITDQLRVKMEDRFVQWSTEGYRVLGLAVKQLDKEKMSRDDEMHLIFCGYILLDDPLKETAVNSIETLKKQQIGVKIITGDNRYAALHAAQKIGLGNPVALPGDEMDKLSPEALVIRVRDADIFAEIEPQQKETIVKALQKSGLTVAFIGDGINDVAAINAADIGISTNNAVDVAKEAADFVFLEKDLSVLADGVTEGRKSFANSMKYIFINTGAIFGNMFSVAGASLLLPFLPMLPKQILLTNLLSDLPYLTIASDHVDKDQLRNPGKWNMKLIRNFMVVFGIHSSFFDFLTFYLLFVHFRLSGSMFQTGWFLESVITELLILYVVRTRKSMLRSLPGRLLIITSLIALLITVFLPLSPFASALGLSAMTFKLSIAIFCVLVAYVITADLVKIFFFRKLS